MQLVSAVTPCNASGAAFGAGRGVLSWNTHRTDDSEGYVDVLAVGAPASRGVAALGYGLSVPYQVRELG